MADVLIPEPIWRRLRAFAAAGKSGTVLLYWKQGRIVEAEFPDRVRHDDTVLESPQSSQP